MKDSFDAYVQKMGKAYINLVIEVIYLIILFVTIYYKLYS